jgi:hypothetical protein
MLAVLATLADRLGRHLVQLPELCERDRPRSDRDFRDLGPVVRAGQPQQFLQLQPSYQSVAVGPGVTSDLTGLLADSHGVTASDHIDPVIFDE